MPSLAALLDNQSLAPHGFCMLWRPELIWLHVGADAATGLAYWSIPIVLALIVRRRRDLMFPWAVDLFALFILACGLSHFIAIWTLWQPDYALQGGIKAITAVLSVATAVILWPLLPRILALPSGAALRDANARLSHEVTERREAERRSHDSEARLTACFEHLSDALFVVRAEASGFVFEIVNPSFCRMFGQPREAIEGHGPDRLLDAAARQALVAEFTACLAAGQPRDWESVTSATASPARLPSSRHWHTVLVPLPAAPDGIPRLLGSLRDVTQLRRLQADAAETAQRATIGAMCAGVAHEMSQPVNIIGLWAERTERALAQDTTQNQNAIQPRRAMEVVLGQTRRLGALLARMRDLVRDEPGAAEVFDAAALAAVVAEAIRADWAPDALAVEFVPPEGATTAPVRGHPAQLEQALRSILDNARDAMLERRRHDPDAPGRLTIRVTADAARQQVGIAIRDTGGGVAAAIAARLMEPFVTTKDPGAGTGLGLAIAAGICRGMGGRLSWANLAGDKHFDRGAEFRLDLPHAGLAVDRAA